jgi:hypothetical protein
MKTLKRSKTNQEIEYLRVNDGEAEALVKRGYNYCSKSEWKTNFRDFGKSEKVEKTKSKAVKPASDI